jgi:hypothetical protein
LGCFWNFQKTARCKTFTHSGESSPNLVTLFKAVCVGVLTTVRNLIVRKSLTAES